MKHRERDGVYLLKVCRREEFKGQRVIPKTMKERKKERKKDR